MLLYVRGQDAQVNWGVVSAVYARDVPEPGGVGMAVFLCVGALVRWLREARGRWTASSPSLR